MLTRKKKRQPVVNVRRQTSKYNKMPLQYTCPQLYESVLRLQWLETEKAKLDAYRKHLLSQVQFQ